LQQDCCCTLSPCRAGTKPGDHTQPKPELPAVAARKKRASWNRNPAAQPNRTTSHPAVAARKKATELERKPGDRAYALSS
jgi:hypothetical protein